MEVADLSRTWLVKTQKLARPVDRTISRLASFRHASSMPGKLVNSFLFLWAGLIGAIISLVTFSLILAREIDQKEARLRDRTGIFLAGKERV